MAKIKINTRLRENVAYNSYEFLDEILISGIQKLINDGHVYFAFNLICQGIEFIGAFFDDKEFDQKGMSEQRFKKGLKLFKNNFYKQNHQFLYKNLRGSLVHQIRPGHQLLLSSGENVNKAGLHLSVVNNNRVFVVEGLFDDFKNAVNRLKKMMEKRSPKIDAEKINGCHLAIYSSTIEERSVQISGGTSQTV